MPSKLNLKTISTYISGSVAKIENNRLFSRVLQKILRPAFVLVLLAILGSAIYFPVTVYSASTATQETGSALQTATAYRGDLVIYASGRGTLIAADEVESRLR